MSNEAITYFVGVSSAVFGLAAYVTLILVPAWTAYTRPWQRFAAAFLTLYVVAAAVLLGVAGGGVLVWFWDRISP
jgi:hypothetical protein